MTLSRLCKKCSLCPNKDECNHKRMEMVGFLEPSSVKVQNELTENLTVPHKYRTVKIAPDTEITIDLEDFKKEIKDSITKNAGLYRGFLNCGG